MSFRYQWYQSDEHVILDFFVKNVARDSVSIKHDGCLLSVSFGDSSEKTYVRDFELCHDVCGFSFSISAAKMEVKLRKATSGLHWAGLLKPAKAPEDVRPSYPTSAKTKTEWDLIDPDNEETSPQARGEGGSVDSFFKSIYSNASEDARRAMMKSFIESGGTVLSTDWKDVGERTVEPAPHPSMEPKKFA